LEAVKKMKKDICVQINDLDKGYYDGNGYNVILSNANYSIHKGDYIAMTGRSGLGKSTFLRIIGTLEKPDSGEVIIQGNNVTALNDKELTLIRRKHIGFVFQQFCLINRFSIKENLELPLFFSSIPKKVREKRVAEILGILGLSEKSSLQKVSSLSGGEKQRIAIGRALINEPLIILADEPTGSLDEKNEEKILDIFDYINTELNTTLLVVTHNERVAKKAKKRITILDKKIFEYEEVQK
jgi:putative ABC transport system ATP-binding protein